MCGGTQNYNLPQQPSYGEGMADAMEAQMNMLLGTDEFAQIYSDAGFEGGDLATIMREVEAPLRKETAQVDTDVLRQTLLGTEREMQVQQDPDTGKFGISGAEVVTDDDGNAQTAGDGRYQIVKLSSARLGTRTDGRSSNPITFLETPPTYGIVDTKSGGLAETIEFTEAELVEIARDSGTTRNAFQKSQIDQVKLFADAVREKALQKTTQSFNQLKQTIDDAGGDPDAAEDAVAQEFTFTNPNIPTDASKAGQPGYDDKGNRLLEGGQNVAEQTITVREGDGMVDLLGDRREIQGQVSDFKGYIENNADLAQAFTDARQAGDTRTIEEFGRDHYEAQGKAEGRELPTTFGDIGRQAGFSETGEFLGAAALAEDIAAGSTSRQRERDISDVERLSGRFKTIMDEFKPAAATGIQGARELIEEQKDKLTTGGDVISDPTKIGADGSYNLTGDAAIGDDTLRAMLLTEAKKGLGEGLTEREQARISEAFKGQSTMMGRTFDQSAGIAEAEAQMKEDNQRRLQNLGIAQSALGQESGLQAGDIARNMSADQFNVATQMDAETKNEQLRQQGLANYIGAVGNLAAIEDQYTLDPFAAILGRGSKDTLASGQGVLGSASYGLQSGPQYLNPESGLGYISQMAANNANIAAAQAAAQGSATSGLLQGLGSLGGGFLEGKFCWVAREVYGPTNPSWLRFRLWMFSESPDWFFKLYGQYGERFASWISDKPRIKSFIRKWMDSKIKE